MTLSRVKVIVATLVCFSLLVGVVATFAIRLIPVNNSFSNQTNFKPSDNLTSPAAGMQTYECTDVIKVNYTVAEGVIYQITQKTQLISYLLCIVSVTILYILIYRSVSKVFRKRRQLKGIKQQEATCIEDKSIQACKRVREPSEQSYVVRISLNGNENANSADKLCTTVYSCRVDSEADKEQEPVLLAARENGGENSNEHLGNSSEGTDTKRPYTEPEASTGESIGGVEPDLWLPIPDVVSPAQEPIRYCNETVQNNETNRSSVHKVKQPSKETTCERDSRKNFSELDNSGKVFLYNHPKPRRSLKLFKDVTVFQNFKTAAMLFVVAIVYILTFIPAILMGNMWCPLYLPIFYLYYVNNAINPIIYGFMNPSFRTDIKMLLCAQTNPRRGRLNKRCR